MAEADLLEIGSYTLGKWGASQAVRYINALEHVCECLAERPSMGMACERIKPGLHRMEQGHHVIFYRGTAGGILVSRILHERMLPELYAMD